MKTYLVQIGNPQSARTVEIEANSKDDALMKARDHAKPGEQINKYVRIKESKMKTYTQILDESRVQDARRLAGNVKDQYGDEPGVSFKKFQDMVDEITPNKTWQAHGMKTIKAAYLMYIDKWDFELGLDNFKKLDKAI